VTVNVSSDFVQRLFRNLMPGRPSVPRTVVRAVLPRIGHYHYIRPVFVRCDDRLRDSTVCEDRDSKEFLIIRQHLVRSRRVGS